jgi:acyl-CoA thioester hydrolase
LTPHANREPLQTMAKKPDPSLLLAETYPFTLSIDTQFGDMDAYAHLNNLAIAGFYESARARIQLHITGRKDFFNPDSADKMLLIEARLQYLAEGHYPEPVEIHTGIGHIGNSSYRLHQALFQKAKCIGLCEAVMIYTLDGKPCSIPSDMRKMLESQRIANFESNPIHRD